MFSVVELLENTANSVSLFEKESDAVTHARTVAEENGADTDDVHQLGGAGDRWDDDNGYSVQIVSVTDRR